MAEKISFHYDCDPGQDDAIALMYALGSQVLDVKSISVVGGNVDVGQCARNALQILELAGRGDIPVYEGAARPMVRPLIMLPDVFGPTGMSGAEDLPDPVNSPFIMDNQKPFDKMTSFPTLVATAPLTNLAMQIKVNTDFSKQVGHLVIMGGSAYPEPVHNRLGNLKTPNSPDYAEYNFAVDPEAAKIVFSAGIENVTMIGLNVTRTVLYNREIEAALLKCQTKCATWAARILSAVGVEDFEDYGHLRQTPNDPVRALHDIVAMACLESPELFEFETLPIRISVGNSSVASGQSIIDWETPDHAAVKVAIAVNKEGLYQKMVENIARL